MEINTQQLGKMQNASEFIYKARALDDEILSKAFRILFGDDFKRFFRDDYKASEMRSILSGGTMPCVSFENWLNCISFLSMEDSIMNNDISIKYSKKSFEGYTHRFKVEFNTDELHATNIDIYSNYGDKKRLEDFIKEKKSYKVISFKIIHIATKEQDEKSAELINEIFKESK